MVSSDKGFVRYHWVDGELGPGYCRELAGLVFDHGQMPAL